MSWLRSFGQVWYDLVIGDDWKIAASVVTALALVVGLLRADVLGDRGLTVLGAALVVGAFLISLAIDVRSTKISAKNSTKK